LSEIGTSLLHFLRYTTVFARVLFQAYLFVADEGSDEIELNAQAALQEL